MTVEKGITPQYFDQNKDIMSVFRLFGALFKVNTLIVNM